MRYPAILILELVMILLEHNLAVLERESIIHVAYMTEDEVQVVRVTRISAGPDALDA